jgi:tripartite-type tricarboxylate transporter receptor subunit TctC
MYGLVARLARSCLLSAAVLTIGALPIRAQEFYAGKTVTILVSGAGAYENYARMLARFMPKYLPGTPTMIVKSMPGGGGLQAANFLAKIAPKDGTTIAATHGAVLTSALLAPDVTDFDVASFGSIGNITRDTYLAYIWSTAPHKTIEDAKTTELIVGGASVGGAGIDLAILVRDVLGYKLKIVSGYKGSNDTKLAMERGEIQGTMGNTISSLRTAGWLDGGQVRVLLQLGNKPHRDFPNVPLYSSITRTAEERQMLDVIAVRNEIAKPYFAPPGIPAARLEMLRRAFDSSIREPEFVAEAARQNMEIEESLTGEELAEAITRITKTPPNVVQKLNSLFKNFKDRT